MKKIVFGHHPCIDGVASMWAVKQALPGEDVDFHGMNYAHSQHNTKRILNLVKAGSGGEPVEVFFVDYLPNDTSVIQVLLDAGHKVNVFDHHQSAKHNLDAVKSANARNPNLRTVFDYRYSGGKIAWRAMNPDQPIPPILELIDRMDLLRLRNETEEKAAAYIDSFPLHDDPKLNISQFSTFHELMEQGGIDALADLGADIWMHEMVRAERLLKRQYDVEIDGEHYPAVRIQDMTHLGRVEVTHMANVMTSPEHPVALMVKQNRALVSVSVRVHPDVSETTYDVVEKLKEEARKVATPEEACKITGGGRGRKGQIGQAAVQMPTSVADKLGLTERSKAQAQPEKVAQRGRG